MRSETKIKGEAKCKIKEAKIAIRKELSEWRDGKSTSEPVTHRDM
jgi:hypothetical protein